MSYSDEKIEKLEQKIEHLQFKQQLLFDNDEFSRLLFEYDITKLQYDEIMSLMEEYRQKISKGEEISHGSYETAIYKIMPSESGNYHMCEDIVRAFMNVGRWEEVFPALYGDFPKYKNLMEQKNGQ